MTGFRLTCPGCGGGVLTPWGHTDAGNQRATCARCYERYTVVAHPDAYGVLYPVNKDAPFYPLVELIDSFTGRPRTSPQEPCLSSGRPQAHPVTIDHMETTG